MGAIFGNPAYNCIVFSAVGSWQDLSETRFPWKEVGFSRF